MLNRAHRATRFYPRGIFGQILHHSGLLHVRCQAPTILQPVLAFEPVVEKRWDRSISMLRVALAAVSTGIVVFQLVEVPN
jgi:hypothetical protein